MSPAFQALVLLQAAVTAGLALLAILYYLRVSREAYLRDWSAAWAMVSLTQVAVIPAVALSDRAPFAAILFVFQTCLYFAQAPLFFLSGYSLARPALPRRLRPLVLGGFVLVGLVVSLMAESGRDWPVLGHLHFGVAPQLFMIGPALVYFGGQFVRHRFRSSRAGAVVTAVSSILFGLHFMAMGSGLLGFSVYRGQALLAAAVSVVLSLGSLCGITLTLMDEVRQSALRIGDIVDSFHAILWESDPALTHFRFVNDAAGDLLGRPVSHWLQPEVGWLEHVAPADREQVASEIIRMHDDQASATELEYRVVAADGSEIYVRNHLRRGALGEWRGVMVNDTERRAAAEKLRISEYRQQQALDSAGAGLYDWDLETGQVYVSARHFQLLGYEQDEFQPTADFFAAALHPDDAEPIVNGFERWLASGGRQFVRQYRIRTKSGAYIWVESRGQLVVAAGRQRVMGTIADISHQKKAEFALAEATRRAQAADRAKSAFLANMSHEIRTPLSGILGLAAMLQDLRLEPRAAELVQLISASGEALSQVLNDILDISKIEAGKLDLNLQPVDLAATLEEVRRFFAPAAEERGLTLVVEPLDPGARWVRADALRLRQVLFNLFSNALKFTPAGTVQASARRSDNGQSRAVEIAVRDTGIGIPAERLDELFQPFIQVDTSLTRRFGGTGLGLAITRNLAELMGGQLHVSSTEGAGSCFWFTLPVDIPADRAVPVAVPPPAAGGLQGLRVLLAEDNQINQLIARRAIEKTGAEVHLAVDGAQALTAALEGNFDVILMDVQMPLLDGLEVTRRIRQHALPRQPYIVALTAHAIAGYRETCLEAGMDYFLTKPLQLDALRAVLVEAGRGHRHQVARAGIASS